MGGRGSSSGMGRSSSAAGNSGGGSSYRADEIPARIQSFTTIGSGVSGDYESKTYVTRNGEAIKTVTTYSNGTKTTYTDMQNTGGQYDRTRAQFESTLSNMAKSSIRTGIEVTEVNGKKKRK